MNTNVNTRTHAHCLDLQVVATLIVIVAATPAAGLFVLPVMLLYYLVQVIYIASSRQMKRIESVSKSPIYSHFGETLQGGWMRIPLVLRKLGRVVELWTLRRFWNKGIEDFLGVSLWDNTFRIENMDI